MGNRGKPKGPHRHHRGAPVSRSALLIDLENMLFDDVHAGSWLGTAQTRWMLTAIVEAAGPVDYAVGVGAWPVLKHVLHCCAGGPEGVRLRQVPLGPDRADQELVELANHLLGCGFGRLVVASGDRRFAAVAAAAAESFVIARPHSLSGALRDAAGAHLLLDDARTATSPPAVLSHA